VSQQVLTDRGKVRIAEVKTSAGNRPIALPAGMVTMLRAHRAAQQNEKDLWQEVYQDARLVFCQHSGLPLEPRNFTKIFDSLVAKPVCRASLSMTSATPMLPFCSGQEFIPKSCPSAWVTPTSQRQ
jgi:hypothetical protein